jgi:AraC-like DNA-binding protein
MVAVAFLRALLDRAAAAGIEAAAVLDDIGVSRETLADVHGWVPVDAMARAWVMVSERAADPDFGLHAAESLPMGVYGVLEYATMSSPNILETLERVARYYRLMGAMGELDLEVRRDRARVTLRPVVPFAPERLRHYHEFTIAFLAVRGRMLGGDRVTASEVRFMHPAPARTTEHERIFRAPVRFGQRTNELVVPRAVLEIPLRAADPGVAAALGRTGETMLAADSGDVVERVHTATRAAIDASDARLESVARRLGMGSRTLQRRLGERGTTYAHVLDQVRRDSAQRWVEQGTMSFGEIAFALGFSEPSAFHRAFKRWTGRTPRDYRIKVPARAPRAARGKRRN